MKLNEKDWILTTLAIIGAGIVGRSLLYNLKSLPKKFERITLFHSDDFAFPCTRHSTAIVALRGVTKGHSSLGDSLVDGYESFKQHIETTNPPGVWRVFQFSGASENSSEFLKRYPNATPENFIFKREILLAREEAYMIDPVAYGEWLLDGCEVLKLEVREDFVTEITNGDKISIRTQNGYSRDFDQVVVAGGNYNRFWKALVPGSTLETSRPVKGSYLEFNDVELPVESFSLTLDGDNLIWNSFRKQILIGSTSHESVNFLPDCLELEAIRSRLQKVLTLTLPEFKNGVVKTGLREKARKREPYVISRGNLHFIGGLYKNAFTFSLHLTEAVARNL